MLAMICFCSRSSFPICVGPFPRNQLSIMFSLTELGIAFPCTVNGFILKIITKPTVLPNNVNFLLNEPGNFPANFMPSNPGQNVHLVSSQIHAVASSSHLANSSSQLVVLSSYLVESSSHLVVLSILLTSPLLVYSSVILQLVVSHFNSPCRTSTRRSLYPSSGQAVSRYK